MKTTLMIATVLAAGTSAVYAQDPPVQPPAATPVMAPTAAAPDKARPSSIDRTSEVRMLEGVFVQAMNQGASDLVRQMQTIDPGSVVQGSVIVSPARARGIALDEYGVLFYVDVPLMNMSVMWTQRMMVVENLRNSIGEARRLRARATSPDDQQQLDARIQMLTNSLSVIAPPMATAAASPVTPVANTLLQPQAGSVIAATVADTAPVTPPDTRSTDEMYSDAIKTALMNAMVNHSAGLMLADDEWLTVAARDNSGPKIPGALEDRSGVILRIKGSDLAAFRANKLSRDEVLKKIEIKEWR